jgi:uncharacterized protein (DUF2147 family)
MELSLHKFLSAALFGALSFAPSAFAADSALDPAGTWLVEDGRAKIKIEKCGPDHKDLCGAVVWLKEPLDDKGHPKTDLKNPDPAKRSRPALGMQLMTNLVPDDDQVYSGQIYNAENGKMYDVTVRSEEAADLRVKGCLVSILCMSQHWKRVADLPMPAPATVAANAQKKAHAAPTSAPAAQPNQD